METIETALRNEQTEFNYDKIYSIEDYLLIESKSFEKMNLETEKFLRWPEQNPRITL